MQTKSVVTTLSLALLFSSSAFGKLASRASNALLSQVARRTAAQAGRRTAVLGRQLPGSTATRRFLSDKVEINLEQLERYKALESRLNKLENESVLPNKPWAQFTTGEKVATGALITVVAPMVLMSYGIAEELAHCGYDAAIYTKTKTATLLEKYKAEKNS